MLPGYLSRNSSLALREDRLGGPGPAPAAGSAIRIRGKSPPPLLSLSRCFQEGGRGGARKGARVIAGVEAFQAPGGRARSREENGGNRRKLREFGQIDILFGEMNGFCCDKKLQGPASVVWLQFSCSLEDVRFLKAHTGILIFGLYKY